MTDTISNEVLEREKLRYEVDKLKIEVAQLRKPFRQPTTVAALVIALLTSGAAGTQYQLNQIQAENTKLEIAKLDGQRETLDQQVKALDTQLLEEKAAAAEANKQVIEAQATLATLEQHLKSASVAPAVYEQIRDSAKALQQAADTSEDIATSLDLSRLEIKSQQGPRASGVLGKFKVGIYYQAKDPAARAFAEQVQQTLTGNVSITQLYPREQAFFDRMNAPMGNEIRYEDPSELPAARELQTLMASRSPGEMFKLRAVGTTTPSFLSIFIDKR